MESTIRKLEKEEFPRFVEIVVNAYPATIQNTVDFKKKYKDRLVSIQDNDESVDFWGLFRHHELLGGMRIHHFKMNVSGNVIDAGGVGLVAVDLLHKKEKVAKELIESFISYFKEKGTSIVMLYPFRPDFYKKMGFGYGTRMNHYEIEPASFPKALSKEGLLYLTPAHKCKILGCANRYAKANHGMILKTEQEIDAVFNNQENKIIGVMDDDLRGYLVFSFKNINQDNFLMNNLIVKEFVYETPKALEQLCGFLQSQADQVNRIIMNTQDADLEYLLSDPRNGSNHLIPSVYHETKTSGIGLMYKIIDVKKFLTQLQIDNHHTPPCRVALTIYDSFHSDDPEKWLLIFENGRLAVDENMPNLANVEMEIDNSDFSSLVMGAVEARKLYQYGKLKLNKQDYVDTINRLFAQPKKPICTTAF
ncbi:GNAT family N-acetyltransferase [Cytobacillus depressus]|uniref:GNAT family N-acetyltransferase n=1 Tax=Cytobacillus depressus TaxID=1602942 RepID=A0A6L3UWW6_9BACI|nr:GNAT family N-acetyltransferase [Cytobacillus depressus]KAB2328627.1 GNAT family N-acetyltransferase [Cytobacillus depressus]